MRKIERSDTLIMQLIEIGTLIAKVIENTNCKILLRFQAFLKVYKNSTWNVENTIGQQREKWAIGSVTQRHLDTAE